MCRSDDRPNVSTYVVVGSGNPVKRRAVEAALGGVDDRFAGAIVSATPVDSGVSEQPVGHGETVAGAENRARAAFERGAPPVDGSDGGTEADLAVGLEGGVAEAPHADGDLFLVMWAAVTDGDRWGRGSGPSLALPADVADRVRAGAELGPVMDETLGEEDVARRQGAVGAFTGGRVDREAALSAAVAGALGPFVTDLYDGE